MEWVGQISRVFSFCLLLLMPSLSAAVGGDYWYEAPLSVAAYVSKLNSYDLGSTLMFEYLPKPSRMISAEVTYIPRKEWWFQQTFSPIGAHIEFALNSSIVKDNIKYASINPYFALRFASFPWNRILFTTFAAGEGVSYATCIPPSEIKPYINVHSTRFLNYLMFELSFSSPKYNALSLLIRVHHRSGAFGLYYPYRDKHACGSNYYGLGIRYAFQHTFT